MLKIINILSLGLLLSCSAVQLKDSRQELRDSVVKYVVKLKHKEKWHGTGFFFVKNNKSYIISNKHVCGDNSVGSYMIAETNDKIQHPVKVLKLSKNHDLCLLESTKLFDHKGLRFANKQLREGNDVHVAGFPRRNKLTMTSCEYIGKTVISLPTQDSPQTCKGRWILRRTLFRTFSFCLANFKTDSISAAAFPGNSGSPAFNNRGKVVGVVFAIDPSTTVSTHLVPLNYIKDFIKGL